MCTEHEARSLPHLAWLVQETMLNEVFSGGLSSYSIVNMVMAYLQSVDYPSPILPTDDAPVAESEAQAGPQGAASSQATAVAAHELNAPLVQPPQTWSSPTGQVEEDVGELLLGLLHYFGSQFDYYSDAVSVRKVNRQVA